MVNLASDNQKQVTSDDQELAKVLAGVTQEAEGMSFEETNNAFTTAPQSVTVQTAPSATPPSIDPMANMTQTAPMQNPAVASAASAPGADPQLASVKQAAITELRPLIDKLDVNPEEKFNTYLLLIRSTDDKALIAPAHEAAKSIGDEAKKAQALLDIIKEIDFLSNPQK